MPPSAPEIKGLKRFLPRIGSPSYHVMLAAVALLILGPLGGVSAAFMNFSIGFFVGGQVLAGILGSTVTLPYGPEGKHGANYMQTMAASVAGMCGMGVLMQAMVWLGLPEPPIWQLVLYYLCIGMFGVGVGMLYTPILVDKMQLAFPSGFAVANILRALTDKNLLKRSVAKLGGGMLIAYLIDLLQQWEPLPNKLQVIFSSVSSRVPGISTERAGSIASQLADYAMSFSVATFGAGMIVGARVALPALMVGLIGELSKPYLVSIQWLEPGAEFKKIGFLIALGMILGAAALDVGLILVQAARRLRQVADTASTPAEDWKRVNTVRLMAWIGVWGTGVVVVGSRVLHQPVFYLIVAVALCFLFVLINGISAGISDSNPISSAFVVTIFIMASLGLKDPGVGMTCASILLIACSEGGDMQQDRSTGWRLGTNRIVQFRYQVIGIALGAVLSIVLAKTFMDAYPVLRVDQFSNSHVPGAEKWQSAMTLKFVGAIKAITNPKPHILKALWLGIGIGLITELARKLLKRNAAYRNFTGRSRTGRVTDFLLDAFFLPNPYASSFGGFVGFLTTIWWALGGVIASVFETLQKRKARKSRKTEDEIPADMSDTSLVGGGLIAGDSLAALSIGIYMLLASGALKKLFLNH